MRPPAALNWDPKPPLPPQSGTESRSETKSSLMEESKSDTGREEEADSSLFDTVVRMSRLSVEGSLSSSCCRSSDREVDDGTGRTNVDGRPRPAKVLTNTLTFLTAILS
ncbi:uncharacterized protein CTRU02_203738 [Colletotrichum truncatum]|uniref:Uncharacterized protein n=1 Tax=Colletotrichum truncatum TaxID=5467 RepID=A0ACC3ZA46_COLTU